MPARTTEAWDCRPFQRRQLNGARMSVTSARPSRSNSFGRAFIADPDLVERPRGQLPIAPVDEATCYQGGDADYLTCSAHRYSA